MSYSEFSLDDIKDNFQITISDMQSLFEDVKSVEINDFLKKILQENIPLALAINTEKARSELIITPILVELRKLADRKISLFSGIDFTVDASKGLKGICDYIISLSPEQLTLTTPVIAIVEAKNDNIKSGMGQCLAEMLGAKMFNEKKGNNVACVYGVITTGSIWKFMKLVNNTAYIDGDEYYLNNLEKIMGILFFMVSRKQE